MIHGLHVNQLRICIDKLFKRQRLRTYRNYYNSMKLGNPKPTESYFTFQEKKYYERNVYKYQRRNEKTMYIK